MEDYNLSWQWHSQETLKSFEVLRKSDCHTDAVLYCDSDSIRAHKVILAACSAYFHRALAQVDETSRYTVILLPKVNAGLLRLALDFMYLGKVTVPSDKLESFMDLAAFLEVRGLEGLAQRAASAEKLIKRAVASTSATSAHSEPPTKTLAVNPEAVPVPLSQLGAMIPTSAGSSLVPIVVPSFTVFKAGGNVVPKTEHEDESELQSIVNEQFGNDESSEDCDMTNDYSDGSGTNGETRHTTQVVTMAGEGTSAASVVSSVASSVSSATGTEDVARGSQEFPTQIPPVIIQSEALRKSGRFVWQGKIRNPAGSSNSLCVAYFCGLCGYHNRHRSKVLRHETTHTGERPHSCSICPSTFGRKEHLRVHMMNVHQQLDAV